MRTKTRIPIKRHREFANRLSTAETSIRLAFEELRGLFQDMAAVPEAPMSAVDRARFEGWLDALQAVDGSAALANHPELRAVLLNELRDAALVMPSAEGDTKRD